MSDAASVVRIDLAPAMPGVAEIVLDRPDKRNALTPEMLGEITRLAGALSAEDAIRAVVLRGEGPVFCAGFDLELCRDDAAALPALLRGLSGAIRALRRCRHPVVVAAHGAAVAGGCALLGGGDLVISHPAAKLGYPVLRMGISPAVNAPSLRPALTDAELRRRLLVPDLFSGEVARRIGLAHMLVDTPEDVIARAQVEAGRFAEKPPEALRTTKRWLNELDGSLDDHAFEQALAASLDLAGSEEQRVRLDAALKR